MLAEQLALVPTFMLQQEIMRRYDHAIFCGVKSRPIEGNPENFIRSWNIVGDYTMCTGLAHVMAARCTDYVIENTQEADVNDL